MSTPESSAHARVGVAYGLGAYLWWGFAVIYFKAIAHVPPLEVLAHRIVWALILMVFLLTLRQRWARVVAAFTHRRTLITLMASAAFVAINWYTWIWAVTHDQVVQASLGYFINPLVNVLLGFVFLHERLRPRQWVAVGLAALGVSYLTWAQGQVPLISLILAFSFGTYGLLRKTVAADALEGLTVEAVLLLPFCVIYLVYLASSGSSSFGTIGWGTDVLLIFGGAMTLVPLLWFANAARRLRLATIGLLQYIAPSMQLVLGVVLYGEAFHREHQIAFAFIWTALAIYTFEALRSHRMPVSTA